MTIQKVVKKYKLGKEPKDVLFWETQSFKERIAAVERLRNRFISGSENAERRLERVYRIIKRK